MIYNPYMVVNIIIIGVNGTIKPSTCWDTVGRLYSMDYNFREFEIIELIAEIMGRCKGVVKIIYYSPTLCPGVRVGKQIMALLKYL